MREIELLAPAKGVDAARAAVDHGADAIYIGSRAFGARSAACNTIENIARATEYAHQYGVKIYATLNTLLFEHELKAAEQAAREVVSAGVDALIIQDMAYTQMNLGVELHGSTQMCNMTPEGAKFLVDSGISRVVAERNLSLEELGALASVEGIELEAFIHGAICVGYSGKCQLSRATTSRSGNRGECSQPCRLKYDLTTASGRKLIEGRHLLSVKDMNLSAHIGEMLDAGVMSLKIEGRLKELSYTKNVVAYYRRAIDKALSERPNMRRSSVGESEIEFTPNPAKSFSRGETEYMFSGRAAGVASFDTPKALGEELGTVEEVRGESFRISGRAEINTGDGLCYVGHSGLVGGGVNRASGGWITLNRAAAPELGATIYRNFDRVFESAVESSRSRRTIAVSAQFATSPDGAELTYTDTEGYQGHAQLTTPLDPARNRTKMEQLIEEQIGKCGDTIFRLTTASTEGYQGEFLAASQLTDLRRRALHALLSARVAGATERRNPYHEQPATYPTTHLSSATGVTNTLAEQFYRNHGVTTFDPPQELMDDLTGERVLESNYCLRREIGECLREGSQLRDPLYLERGGERFRLVFDCKMCAMSLIKE